MDELERANRETQAAQELLFLVLDHIGEPVVLDVEYAKAKMADDRRIDLDLDTESGKWTLQVVTVHE